MTLLQESRFGLLPFFEAIAWRELNVFAKKNWQVYYYDDQEGFLMEVYILCLENADDLENLCLKAIKGVPEDMKHIIPEDVTDLNNTPQYAYIAKSFQKMFKTFLRNHTMRWWDKNNSEKWQELRYKNNSFKPNVINALIKQAEELNFPIPQELKDEYMLRHLRKTDAISRVTHKHNLKRQTLAWRRRMWAYRFLTFLEKPINLPNEYFDNEGANDETYDNWDF